MVGPRVFLLFGLALAGCGLLTPTKTTKEELETKEWAEAKQRASTYYAGGEFVRAAAQYKKALDLKPYDYMTQLGYAYSLTNTRYAPNILLALKYFNESIGRQYDENKEVKRVFGMGEAHRLLAMFHRRRSEEREDRGLIDESKTDRSEANEYAKKGIEAYEQVLVIDKRLEAKSIAAPLRPSATLAPMARIGIAVCCIVLGDREDQAPIERAVHEVNQYAETAAKAREFWTQRRQKKMEIDPINTMVEGGSEQMQTVEERRRYDELIKGTIEKEALVRQGLAETYMYLERFDEAIRECTRMLELDDEGQPQALFLRARCYALQDPPEYERALEDLREYRSRQDLTRLTQEVIRINQLIKMYEKRLARQRKEREFEQG